MQEHIDTTHKHLGELAMMAHHTQAAEQKILDEAEKQLAKVEKDLPKAASAAMTTGEEAYTHLIAERGRLHQVIAQARKNLGAA